PLRLDADAAAAYLAGVPAPPALMMTAVPNALLERYPVLNERLPWVSLGVQRTPLTTHEIDGRAVMLKRDDLVAEPYGGNKVRKLEFLLARARAEGATRIVTAGATGSHHALATTIYGRRSEERRVGKECRSRAAAEAQKDEGRTRGRTSR